MQKIVTAGQMRVLETEAEAAGVPTAELMERAGLAVARAVRSMAGGAAGLRIVALVGPGNNGGDGLVAARHLVDWGAHVEVFCPVPRTDDGHHRPALLNRGVPLQGSDDDAWPESLAGSISRADIVLDALLGTGRSRPLAGNMAAALGAVREEQLRRPALKAVAVDLPTGVDADSGALDPAAFRADLTVALGFPKCGVFRYPGAEVAGCVVTVDIGIPAGAGKDLPLELITLEDVRRLLPDRPPQANKGTFGRALVIAGSGRFPGAAALACMGAHRCGAGLVTLAGPAPLVSVAAARSVETTLIPLPATPEGAIASSGVGTLPLDGYDAVAVGCGLGQDLETRAFLEGLLLRDPPPAAPVVLDADALNILSGVDNWWHRLRSQAVLTPHPGEMARLLKTTVAAVQSRREDAAQEAARAWGQVVVLKGAYTVVAAPEGPARISPFAVPALASGGTGDVLTGMIAALLSQGVQPFDAATAAVYLHGLAGQRFTESRGDSGLIASDLPALLPDLMAEMRAGRSVPPGAVRAGHSG